MQQEIREALAALDIKTLAPNKGTDKAIVAVKLSRDPAFSGKRTTAIVKGWQPCGLAVALQAGNMLAANPIFGHWSHGVPTVSPCVLVKCGKCGKLVPMPFAVWSAKDKARRDGAKDNFDEGLKGAEVLERWGSCDCGGKWVKGGTDQKKLLDNFTDAVLRGLSTCEKVPQFLPPKAFSVIGAGEQPDIGPEWEWLKAAMNAQGKSVMPFSTEVRGDIILHNPGDWFGYTDDPASTGLFFTERLLNSGFNPLGCDGL